MINLRYLETFIRTADCGSFHKASDAMFITPSAVIKQIDALEEETGTILFERTYRGLKLTASGRSLYTDGKVLLDYAEHAEQRARSAGEDSDDVLRVGTSPVTGAELVTDLWQKIYPSWPELKIQIIPFQNTPEKVIDVFESLGKEIDLITGICDETHLAYRKCAGTPVEQVSVDIAVSFRHPLVNAEIAGPGVLRDEKVYLLSEGKMDTMDRIRHDLKHTYPEIQIMDFDFFGMDVFNRCEKENAVLITTAHWIKAHPMLRLVKMDWDYTVPYGLLYSRTPSPKIRRFLSLIKE